MEYFTYLFAVSFLVLCGVMLLATFVSNRAPAGARKGPLKQRSKILPGS